MTKRQGSHPYDKTNTHGGGFVKFSALLHLAVSLGG